MAMWLFTDAILAGRPIKLFNHGNMRRDFTYVDDVAESVVRWSTAARRERELVERSARPSSTCGQRSAAVGGILTFKENPCRRGSRFADRMRPNACGAAVPVDEALNSVLDRRIGREGGPPCAVVDVASPDVAGCIGAAIAATAARQRTTSELDRVWLPML